MQRFRRVAGQVGAPQLPDQAVGGDDPAYGDGEQGNELALPQPGDRQRTSLLGDLERPQDPDLHASKLPARGARQLPDSELSAPRRKIIASGFS